jgi:hypothetical protein
MAAFTDKLTKAAGDALRGEPMLAGCRATPKGGLRKAAVTIGIGGMVGAAIANRGVDNPDGFPTASNMSLGLTPTRLIAFSNGAMTGGPKAVIGEVPLASIAAVDGGSSRAVGLKTGRISITLNDGSSAEFDVPKISMRDADQFVTLLQHRISSRG